VVRGKTTLLLVYLLLRSPLDLRLQVLPPLQLLDQQLLDLLAALLISAQDIQ